MRAKTDKTTKVVEKTLLVSFMHSFVSASEGMFDGVYKKEIRMNGWNVTMNIHCIHNSFTNVGLSCEIMNKEDQDNSMDVLWF